MISSKTATLIIYLLMLLSCLLFWLTGIVPPRFELEFAIAALCCGFFLVSRTYTQQIMLLYLVVGSLTFSTTVFDTMLRITSQQRFAFRPHDILFQKSVRFADSYRYTPNSQVRMKVIGDLASLSCNQLGVVSERTVEFTTDEHGFRSFRRAASEPVKLVFLGDSFGVGVGVSDDLTWWSQVAKNSARSGVNLSLPGSPLASFRTFLQELRHLTFDTAPVFIWFLFEGNDVSELAMENVQLAPMPMSRLQSITTRVRNYQRRSPVKKLLRLLIRGCTPSDDVFVEMVEDTGKLLMFKPYLRTAQWEDIDTFAKESFSKLRYVFREMEELSEAHAARVLIAVVPSKERIYSKAAQGSKSFFADTVAALSSAHGFSFLDFTPVFKEQSLHSAEPLYWRDDTHWSEAGHSLAAKVLLEKLHSLGGKHHET